VWRETFIKIPYLRDEVVLKGIIAETFETCCTWDNFETLYNEAIKSFNDAIKIIGGKGIITCRFTHVYPDGPAPYFSTYVIGTPKRQLEEWDFIKKSVSNVLVRTGGTITHHHAVGRDHQPFYERECDPLYLKTLYSLKKTLDPNGIMNPGVLIGEIKSKL